MKPSKYGEIVGPEIPEEHLFTLPETHIAPENQWLEDEFPFGMAHFHGYVSFRECTYFRGIKQCNRPVNLRGFPVNF